MQTVREREKLALHGTSDSFWKYFAAFKFVQVALYLVMLETKGVRKRTMENNLNSFRKIVQLYHDANITVMDVEACAKAQTLVSDAYLTKGQTSVYKIATLNGYLKCF